VTTRIRYFYLDNKDDDRKPVHPECSVPITRWRSLKLQKPEVTVQRKKGGSGFRCEHGSDDELDCGKARRELGLSSHKLALETVNG
jgi:hypothetical protein